MRLAFVLDRTNMGGAERHALSLARDLAANGHEVETISLLRGGSPNFPTEAFPQPLHRIGGKSILEPRVPFTLGRAVAAARTEVIFAVNQRALLATLFARWLLPHRAKVVEVFHTTVLPTAASRLRFPLFKAAVKRSDAIIFVSGNQCDYWRAQGLEAPLTLAIPNGIDTADFTPPSPERRTAARTRLGIRDEEIVLCLCGRFSPEKNHGQLVDALARLAPVDPRYRLLFVGDGELRSEVESKVRSLDLTGRVIFAGESRDVGFLLAAADAGVLVSNAVETFSLAALEIMATGLPVVLSDIGGASEMIIDGESGLLFPPNDTGALVRALTRLGEEGHRKLIGANARQRVLDRYTREDMIAEYERFLRLIH